MSMVKSVPAWTALDQVHGWCVALVEDKIIPWTGESSIKGIRSAVPLTFQGTFGFLHLSFKLCYFKTSRSTASLHFLYLVGILKQTKLNVWSRSGALFWFLKIEENSDKSLLLYIRMSPTLICCCFLTAWHSSPILKLISSTHGLQSLGHGLTDGCILGSIFIF